MNIIPGHEPCYGRRKDLILHPTTSLVLGDVAHHDLGTSSARFLTLQHIQVTVYGLTSRLLYLWIKKKPIPIECEAGWSTERDYGEKNLPSVGCRTPIPRSLTSRLNKCIELPCCVICYYYYFKSQKRKH